MSEWLPHDGKGMPVEPTVKVDVKFRDGDEAFGIEAQAYGSRGESDECWWSWHGDKMTNVTHWRLHTTDGWIDHDGGPIPVDGSTWVEATNKNGWSIRSEACYLKWEKVEKYKASEPVKMDGP